MKRLALAALLFLGACSTVRETLPSRSATEQLLISSSIDAAASQLKLTIPAGRVAFLDTAALDGVDNRYAASLVKMSLLKQGVHLIDDRSKADTIIFAFAGAMSMDAKTRYVGVPSITIPSPTPDAPNQVLITPNLTLYNQRSNTAITKLQVFAVDAQTGAFIAASDPAIGSAYKHTYSATQ